MMTFTTIIPKQRNDGTVVPKREMQAILRALWKRFGGLTDEGEVNGYWIDAADGKQYHDRGIRVTVACERERLDDAKQAVLAIGKQLGQKAMYFEVSYYDGVQILKVE